MQSAADSGAVSAAVAYYIQGNNSNLSVQTSRSTAAATAPSRSGSGLRCWSSEMMSIRVYVKSPMGRAVRSLARDIHGVAAIEFAIVAPMLVLAMVCTADLGLGIYRKMQVQNAAQAGAEYAIVHGYVSASITTAVSNATTFSGISATPAPSQFCGCPSSTGVTTTDCGGTCSGGSSPGTYVSVGAQAKYTTILPYPIMPNSFTFNARSTVRIQ